MPLRGRCHFAVVLLLLIRSCIFAQAFPETQRTNEIYEQGTRSAVFEERAVEDGTDRYRVSMKAQQDKTRFLANTGAATTTSNHVTSGQPADPIMGILSQPNVHDSWKDTCGEYVQQTYVEWLAMAGVRAVPVRYTASADELISLLGKINGVLFTGGVLDHFQKYPEFYTTAARVFNYTLERNAKGDPFVLWGTCQGFELIATIAANSLESKDFLPCDFTGVDPAMLPLDVVDGAFESSRFFSELSISSPLLQNDFTRGNTTANLHHCGIEPNTWDQYPSLKDNFKILSKNADSTGREFVSTYEHNTANVYATQWHPELSEFWYLQGISKAPDTLRVSQYAGDFLASKLRAVTDHSFRADDNWLAMLLWQYPIVHNMADAYTGFFCVDGSRSKYRVVRETGVAVAVVAAVAAVAMAAGVVVLHLRRYVSQIPSPA